MHLRLKIYSSCLILSGFLSAGLGTSFADWTATGTFQYQDREFDLDGFTGTVTSTPVRYADVEILDVTGGGSTVLASGGTDASGNFSIAVTDASARDVKVRCLTSSDGTSSLKVTVRNHITDSTAGNDPDDAVISVSSSTTASHDPNTNLSFGTVTAADGSGGEEFNIFDVLVDGSDYIASLAGSRPAVLVTAYWESGSTDGTYYCPQAGSASSCGRDNSIHLYGTSSDSDGYDDTVIAHEYGHFVAANYSGDDSPGGSHSLTETDQDIRLSWSEGWATFFQCTLRDFKGFARPEIYVDTVGSSGTFSYEVETPDYAAYAVESDNEVSVNALLWDIFDTTATADATAGTDDDSLDGSSLAGAMSEIWEVFSTYMSTAQSVSLEDFWDGWFSASIANDYFTEMSAIFSGRSVEFATDIYEADDSPASASAITTDGSGQRRTYYAGGADHTGDDDWAAFSAEANAGYALRTSGLGNGADTVLSLYGTNGSTLIDSNDDVATGNLSSRIAWQADAAGAYFAKSEQYSGAGATGTYGSYDLDIVRLLVSSISPNTGSEDGGTGVTITGEGFLTGATVTIGGNSASSVSVLSATSITATAPAGTSGAQDVAVNNPSGSTGTRGLSATLSGGFTYSGASSDGGGGGGGGGCFVATAVYGTRECLEVQTLCNFRDRYLLTNPPGRVLVSSYYKIGPYLADFVEKHPGVRSVLRKFFTKLLNFSII